MSVEVDSDHHVVSMRMSFAAAGTAASVVVVLMVLAFLVGRRVGAGGLPAVVESTEQLRQHPPHPTVLNVGRQTAAQSATPLLLTSSTSSDAPATVQPQPAQPSVVGNAPRQVGLNYIIAQSYPEEKTASDARDALVTSGIPCTVEVGLPGWMKYSVVGSVGFDKPHGPQYDAYIQAIQAVSTKFAGTSKFKRFEPHAYKWKETR